MRNVMALLIGVGMSAAARADAPDYLMLVERGTAGLIIGGKVILLDAAGGTVVDDNWIDGTATGTITWDDQARSAIQVDGQVWISNSDRGDLGSDLVAIYIYDLDFATTPPTPTYNRTLTMADGLPIRISGLAHIDGYVHVTAPWPNAIYRVQRWDPTTYTLVDSYDLSDTRQYNDLIEYNDWILASNDNGGIARIDRSTLTYVGEFWLEPRTLLMEISPRTATGTVLVARDQADDTGGIWEIGPASGETADHWNHQTPDPPHNYLAAVGVHELNNGNLIWTNPLGVWISENSVDYPQLQFGQPLSVEFQYIKPLMIPWSPCGENCPGDFNSDCTVGLADLATLIGNYNLPSGATYADGDLDGDGDVDLFDLIAFLPFYGDTCE